MSFSIRSENCEYRAEGNAAIVVRLIKEEKVLRLKKKDASETGSSASDDYKNLECQLKITENVLKPILGECFVNKPLIVSLKKEDVRILNETVSRFRPADRKHKNVKEEDSYVYMLPDYCCFPRNLELMPTYGPVLCIELKPKQGYMRDEYLSSNLPPQPLPMCRFCLMQKFKLKRGLVSSKSGYCPTDLYSGCQKRMLHALKMLFKTPQNNLRIFKNQNLIYSEEKKENFPEMLSDFAPSRSTDLLCDLIIQALLKPFPSEMNKIPISSEKKYSQNCINAHTPCSENDLCQLPPYCVLERILSVQLLDDLPIKNLFQLYLHIKENKDKCSDSIGCYSRSQIPSFVGELNRSCNESEYQYASRKVWEFLVALVMKDCSVMITLKHLNLNSLPETHTQNIISDGCGNLYVFSIAIADLDAKSFNKVEKITFRNLTNQYFHLQFSPRKDSSENDEEPPLQDSDDSDFNYDESDSECSHESVLFSLIFRGHPWERSE